MTTRTPEAPTRRPTEPEDGGWLSHRKNKVKATIAAVAAVAAGIVGAGVATSGGNSTEHRGVPSTSAPADPSDSAPVDPEQTATSNGEITMENLNSYMIEDGEYSDSPEEISGHYSNIITNIVNTRFKNKEFGMKTDDLVLLVDPSNAELTESYARYIDNLVGLLVEKEKLAEEKGIADDGVMAGIAVELTSGEMTADGAEIEVKHDYRVNTGIGEYLGSLLGNDDATRLTFAKQDVTLPNGDVTTALRITDRYDILNNQPY